MKAKIRVFGLITILIVTLIVQQITLQGHRDRISDLEGMLADAGATGLTPDPSRHMDHSSRPIGRKTGARLDDSPAPAGGPAGSDDDTLRTSLRRMSENPAGRALMNQGIKAMSAMWFADLVDQFGLSREEEDYFLRLVAGGMSSQQQVGMKMMTAETDEDREALQAESEQARMSTREAIRDFLNNDEDFAAYERYNEQLPERQQIEGLRNTMLEAGTPLTPDQEKQVIEAMYKVRTTQAPDPDWQGDGDMDAIVSGDAASQFERAWERSSRATAAEVGKILEGKQLEAFQQYQAQMMEMQLMQIKMAEKMLNPQEEPGTGNN